MRKQTELFEINNSSDFKQQMLSWANRFSICFFLDSNNYADARHSFDALLSVEPLQSFSAASIYEKELTLFFSEHDEWLFGHVCYDAGDINTKRNNPIDFNGINFFTAGIVIQLEKNVVTVSCATKKPSAVFSEIKNVAVEAASSSKAAAIDSRISREEYIEIIKKLQAHILRGDCYEINFCQEFFAEDVELDTLQLYKKLIELSPSPFSAYYKLRNKYLLSTSPERFLKKQGTKIIAQPIKGTIKRNLQNTHLDEALKAQLSNSAKDKQENIMIVDLLRNDLSKICKEGTVKVEELFGIYSYPQVHQMISTITGEVNTDINFAEVLQATFPMGSMTGAPKQRVMQLINQYEQMNRNIYSGCVGYITPEKDFDFNVIIRSIMYNATNRYASFWAGSGITFNSDAENEYEECILKAAALQKVLSAK